MVLFYCPDDVKKNILDGWRKAIDPDSQHNMSFVVHMDLPDVKRSYYADNYLNNAVRLSVDLKMGKKNREEVSFFEEIVGGETDKIFGVIAVFSDSPELENNDVLTISKYAQIHDVNAEDIVLNVNDIE